MTTLELLLSASTACLTLSNVATIRKARVLNGIIERLEASNIHYTQRTMKMAQVLANIHLYGKQLKSGSAQRFSRIAGEALKENGGDK